MTQNQAQKRLQEGLKERLGEGEGAPVKGASHTTFYNILAGRTSPRADFLFVAGEVLGVSPTWFFDGGGEMEARKPFGQQDVDLYSLRDLPEWVQHDVVGLAEMLFGRTDKRGVGVRDVRRRIAALSESIAAWLRVPLLHSNKFRRPKSEWEAIQFCEDALRALQFLVPEPGDPPTPGGPDGALVALAEMERGLAGRDEVPKDQEASDDLRQDRGDELRKVEVVRLSADQRRASELSADHRRKARQDEAEKLAAEQSKHARRQRQEPPPGDGQEPLPTEPGPAVLGEEYSGPPVEPEEFTPQEKKALAERKRLRKVRQKKAAKRDQQRS